MADVVALGGTVVTDAMVDQWVDQIESGRIPGRPGKTQVGRPRVADEPLRPVTVRLDHARTSKLRAMAERRHVSRAQIVRDLIDNAPA